MVVVLCVTFLASRAAGPISPAPRAVSAADTDAGRHKHKGEPHDAGSEDDHVGMAVSGPTETSQPHAPSHEESTFSGNANAPRACDSRIEPRPDDWLERELRSRSPVLADALDSAEDHRLQIVVGEAFDGLDRPCVRYAFFRRDAEYYYPASAIKHLAAMAVLRLMASVSGWELDTPLRLDALEVEGPEGTLKIREEEQIHVRALVERALIVSSNTAYNGLFDLVGPARLERYTEAMGWSTARIQHRLGNPWWPEESHRVLPAVALHRDGRWKPIQAHGPQPFEPRVTTLGAAELGRGYLDDRVGEVIEEPLDFSHKNAISLFDLHRSLQAIVEPVATGDSAEPGLAEDSRAFLFDVMGRRPDGETEEDVLRREARFKPLSPGVLAAFGGDRGRFDYVNKAGRAYGFHLDNAYIKDRATGRAFFVAATVWANENQVLNDNRYEYESFSYPFFVELGRVLTQVLLLEPTGVREGGHSP